MSFIRRSSCGAGEAVLPLTGVVVRAGSLDVDGCLGDDGAGGNVASCAADAAVRSASLVSGSMLASV